jgi:hypothetical protein
MKFKNIYKSAASALFAGLIITSCTKLDQKVYSVVPNDNFWQTPDQIAAGIAPAYQALTGIPNGAYYNLTEATTDEQIVPTRGGDWYDNGNWQALWMHTYSPTLGPVNDTWNSIYNGIGKINFTLSIVDNLPQKPDNIANIDAELKTLRAYYYFLAMDMFGNVPLVTDFNVDPADVKTVKRADVFTFVEKELKDNLPLLNRTVDLTTYGRVTAYFAHAVLAKIYLNAQVYTGTERWADCVSECDSIISSGKYSLQPQYFDNFAVQNQNSVENIFVVPYDNVNIGGNSWEMQTLHYNNQINFQLTGQPYNGFCSAAAFYNQFDTTSDYVVKGANTYRTFHDARAGQYLVGQQYKTPFTYPPNQDVLYSSTDASLKLRDEERNTDVNFTPNITKFSDPSSAFRVAGVRNIKYFPEAGTAGNQSNDMVIFRLADFLLMKAEALVRLGSNTGTALDLVNQVRERAYGGDASHDWKASDLTLDNILSERGREMAWETWRRQDLIRYEVASGKQYYGAARVPEKPADPADGHLNIFPIPEPQITANPNLTQNPGYQ